MQERLIVHEKSVDPPWERARDLQPIKTKPISKYDLEDSCFSRHVTRRLAIMKCNNSALLPCKLIYTLNKTNVIIFDEEKYMFEEGPDKHEWLHFVWMRI